MATINFHVVDIYHGDKVSSFKKAADAGLWGAIHKATTGATGKDSKYATRRQAALKAGLLWGAYHWGTAADVEKQVKNFINRAEPDDDTLVALDFEETKDNQMTLAQARDFLAIINETLGRKAVIYGGGLLKSRLGNAANPFFGSHRLWLAHYNPHLRWHMSWKKYWLWQYTDRRGRPDLFPDSVSGIPGNAKGDLDCDSYDGSKSQLRAEWAS